MQADLDLVQLGFAHDPGQAKQQAIMINAGIIQSFAIGDEGAEQGTQFQKLMPVAIVARQARCVEAQH
jgi:hypothetical protein